MAVEFSDRLLEHLAMAWIAAHLQLLRQPLTGKQQAVTLPVALLLTGREPSSEVLAG
ncbi:MAG: hypothetical protein ABSD75_10020 [Terriglobales bacterium]